MLPEELELDLVRVPLPGRRVRQSASLRRGNEVRVHAHVPLPLEAPGAAGAYFPGRREVEVVAHDFRVQRKGRVRAARGGLGKVELVEPALELVPARVVVVLGAPERLAAAAELKGPFAPALDVVEVW